MTNLEATRMRAARRDDVPAIVALLADDHLGRDREDPAAMPAYLAAFERIAADARNLLAVAETGGRIVGTLQITFIPGLSNQGAELALLAAVRVDSGLRGRGLGRVMVEWAMDQARARGCRAMELLTHSSRQDAQRFYEQLGFARTHAGMRRRL